MRKNQRILSGVLITLVLLSVFSVSPVYASKKRHRSGSDEYPDRDAKIYVKKFDWDFKETGGKKFNKLKVKGTIKTKNVDTAITVTLYVVSIESEEDTTQIPGVDAIQSIDYEPEKKIKFKFKWWAFPSGWYLATVTVEYQGEEVWSTEFIFDPPGGGPGPMY